MNRKYVYISLAGLTLFFLLKKKKENVVDCQIEKNNPQVDFSKKIEKIKVEIFHLIEAFHYKYKGGAMTNEDLTAYEKMINKMTK